MKSMFTTFKKSNAAKVGSAYVVVAWIVLQLIEVVLPTFEAPTWIGQTIIFVLVLGFPITLILAWASQPKLELEVNGNSPQESSQVNGLLIRRLILFGGPSAAVAGLLTFILFPPNLERETEASNNLTNASLTLSTDPYNPQTRPVRSSLVLGQTRSRAIGLRSELALSDDGSRLVFNSYGETGGINMNLLELDSLTPVIVQDVKLSYDFGYCNCGGPSFSPDGEWILYVEDSYLKRVRAEGSTPQQISENQSTFGAHWTEDGEIIYTDFLDGKLYSMSAAGRSLQLLEGQLDSRLTHSFPFPIDDTGSILYTAHPPESVSLGDTYLLNSNDNSSSLLIEDSFNARYAPSGHVVFVRNGSIWAVPFDKESLIVTGEEVPIISGIETWADRGVSNFDFSNYGRLVYLPGEEVNASGRVLESDLVWLNRDGTRESIDVLRQPFSWPQISPNGEYLALTVHDSDRGNSDIWVYDFALKTLGKRTFSGNASRAIWNRDSSRIFFRTASSAGVANGIWSVATNGAGSPEIVVQDGVVPLSFSLDNSTLIYGKGLGTNRNIYSMQLGSEAPSEPLLPGSTNISNAQISPDGNWISYVSLETGINQVYVRPYPKIELGKWQVSLDGGREPTWSSDNKFLYFVFGDNLFEIANLSRDIEEFSAGLPQIVGDLSGKQGNLQRNYDVHPTEGKVLFMQTPERGGVLNTEITSLVMVENWFEELKRLAPSNQ